MAGGQGYTPGPMQQGGMTAQPMPGVLPQGPQLGGGRFPMGPGMTPGGPSMGGGRMPMPGGPAAMPIDPSWNPATGIPGGNVASMLGGGTKPMPPSMPPGGMDQWAGVLPPRLQAQIAAGLPLEQAIGRFQGQLQGDQGMPAWQNPVVQELMGGQGGNKPMPGGERPQVPYGNDLVSMPMPGVDQGRTARPGVVARPPIGLDRTVEFLAGGGQPAQGVPAVQSVGQPGNKPAGAGSPPNAYTQALAAATRPGFDSAVRGGGYDWKRDRDRALGQGEFAAKPAIATPPALPGNPNILPVEPPGGPAGKPNTKPAPPKGARRLPKY